MGNTLFRATRYALDHPAFTGKTLTPGKTLVEIQQELDKPQPNKVTISANRKRQTFFRIDPETVHDSGANAIERWPRGFRGHRVLIPVWMLEQARRLGTSEADSLRDFAGLRAADLVNAWSYVAAHCAEIEEQIRANEETTSGPRLQAGGHDRPDAYELDQERPNLAIGYTRWASGKASSWPGPPRNNLSCTWSKAGPPAAALDRRGLLRFAEALAATGCSAPAVDRAGGSWPEGGVVPRGSPKYAYRLSEEVAEATGASSVTAAASPGSTPSSTSIGLVAQTCRVCSLIRHVVNAHSRSPA